MILEKQKEANILVEGETQESIEMSLDLDSAQMLMQMLSKNLYSDGIGSTIRETCSNAFDSHKRAGVKEPIIVSLKENNNYNYEFCVEDFGIGLDDEDVKNIISKYGKSTKRLSNNELGMFGLGFKSPLAYSSSFYFVCRKDGVERKYMMYEGEDMNTIDLLYETPTEERSGVKVIVPVKYQDLYQFKLKIKEQLCYFEDVYFDVPSDSYINNDFSIIRHEDFQFSELSSDSKLHICLDNVYYPLDFDKLGIKSINFPIALRFSLSDGVYPIPTRESIRYTQETKEIIKNKLKVVSEYFVNSYNESLESGMNLSSYIEYIENQGINIKFNNIKYNIESFIQYSSVSINTPELLNLKLVNFKKVYSNHKSSILDSFCSLKFSITNNRFSNSSKQSYNWRFNVKDVVTNPSVIVYYYEDKIPLIKKEYLKYIHRSNDHVLLVKFKDIPLGRKDKYSSQTYYHTLELGNYPKSQWREVIKEYQSVLGEIKKDFINLDELIIPKSFVDSRKKVVILPNGNQQVVTKRQKLKGEISGKRAEELQKFSSDRNCKFVPIIYKLETLSKSKHLKIYSVHEDYLKLDALYGVIGKQKIELVTFSQREINVIKDLKIHNLISLEKFMEGNTEPFKRMATAYSIKKIIDTNKYVFQQYSQIGYTSTTLKDKILKVKNYYDDNFYLPSYSGGTGQSKEFLDSMLVIAENNKLFDMNIYPEVLELKEILNKLTFLNTFCSKMGYYNEESDIVNVMNDLFKYYKQKINLKHYKIKINEETLTEEQVEQLID